MKDIFQAVACRVEACDASPVQLYASEWKIDTQTPPSVAAILD